MITVMGVEHSKDEKYIEIEVSYKIIGGSNMLKLEIR